MEHPAGESKHCPLNISFERSLKLDPGEAPGAKDAPADGGDAVQFSGYVRRAVARRL